MIALVSAPCIAPDAMPSGIAILKGHLAQTQVQAKCFYLANEFELGLANKRPDLKEVYANASEIGSDYQNPFFSALVFGHEDPAGLVKAAIRLVFARRAQLPSTLDDTEVSERQFQSQLRREFHLALSFCETLKAFCQERSEHILSHRPSLIGFSCLSSQLFVALYMARLIKERSRSTSIVFGGGFLTRWNADFYSTHLPNIDHLIVGRHTGDITEFLKSIGDGQRKSKLMVASEGKPNLAASAPDFSDGV
ncbi:MAG: cobalamin-dependent protein, partial [Phycisphaerales bacterium]